MAIRIKRVEGRWPLRRRYLVELTPPDSREPWRTQRPTLRYLAERKLYAEGHHTADIGPLFDGADALRGQADRWYEFSYRESQDGR